MLKNFVEKIPKPLKSFYFIFSVSFFVWMMFFDTNDFINQYRMSSKLSDLENEKEYYQEKIEEVKIEKDELFSDNEKLEKFAREKYLMKKNNEDVYIIEQD